jgi:hypothetical protein
MKAILCLTAIAAVSALSSCDNSLMVASQSNGATGQSSQTVYSGSYMAGKWIVPKRLGLAVLADNRKTTIPVLYGLQRSIGALGPGDMEAPCELGVGLWNFGDKPVDVKILSVSYDKTSHPSGETITAHTHQEVASQVAKKGGRPPVSGKPICRFTIPSFETELPIKVVYEIEGRKRTMALTLKRQTTDEVSSTNRLGGLSPYTWPIKDSKE